MAMPGSRYAIGTIPWYSLLIVSGAVLAIFLASREEKKAGLPKDTVLDLALWVLPVGILGARLYYVLFSWSTFRSDWLSVFRIWEGGLAIFGGIIAGFTVVLVFSRRRHLSPWLICDLIVPGLVLAQAIGRWGNYFNMEAYGQEILNPAWQFFPAAVLIPSDGMNRWYMATFFYESVWNLGVFLFLLWARRHLVRREGDLLLLYLLGYGSGRVLIEALRSDSLYATGIRVSQLLSFLLILSVFLFWLLLFRRKKRSISVAARILLIFWAVLAVPVCLLILRIGTVVHLAASVQVVLLSVFSLLSLLSGLTLYGKTVPEERCYAYHQS